MQSLPNQTTLQQQADVETPHQSMGLRVVTGGQGILRRISGPAMLAPVDASPMSTGPEETSASGALVPAETAPPSPPATADRPSLRAELEEAIDKLVGQDMMSFRVLYAMSTNTMGGTMFAQHTYLNSLATIHAIDVAEARAHDKLHPQRLRAAKRIQHPNLINVLHHATHHRFILVFTDAMEGVLVSDLLAQEAPMAESHALAIVQGVCEGLAAGHENQLTHGGICPKHIFVSPTGQPKIVDYCWHLYVPDGGLDPFACSQSVYGSVDRWTRAPETFTDAAVDYRADIYALGATFHQMVTGQHPFPAIVDPHLRHTQSQSSLKLPHQLNPSLSRETSEIITAMIEPNPNRRPSDYGDVIQLLQSRLLRQQGKQTLGKWAEARSSAQKKQL